MAFAMRYRAICQSIGLVGVLAIAVAGCGKGEEKGGKKKKTDSEEGGSTAGGGEDEGDKPAKGGDYKEVDSVANAGTIKGTITYTGSKQPEKLNVTKDPNVCTHGGEPDRSIQVADGKLKNAVVAISDDIKEGKKWEIEKAVVDNKECLFEPHIQIGRYKGQVEAKNDDPLLHNTNLALAGEGTSKTLANIALPQQGGSQTKDLKKAGVVAVKCDVHEWMKAWIYVSKHPYVAISGDDGTFEIANVPAGEYNVKVWHEVFGEKDAKVKVDAGGTATLDHAYN
jgi:Polysaccharide lyase family 4, domain II